MNHSFACQMRIQERISGKGDDLSCLFIDSFFHFFIFLFIVNFFLPAEGNCLTVFFFHSFLYLFVCFFGEERLYPSFPLLRGSDPAYTVVLRAKLFFNYWKN